MEWTLLISCILALLSANLVWGKGTCPRECECREDIIKEQRKRVLDCSDRDLTRVPSFMDLAGETFDFLYLNKNQISNLQARAFRGLTVHHLDLSDNRIHGVSDNAFKSVDGMQELVIERSGLSSAPVALMQLKHLKILKLRENKITQLSPRVFEPLRNLHYLDVSLNKLDFTYPFDGFETLKQLKTLKLGGCEMDNIPEDALQDVAGKLKVLVLRDNNIRDIPAGLLQRMKNLEQLDLENNPIRFKGDVQDFRGLRKLKVLKLGLCDMGGRLNTSVVQDNIKLKTLKVLTCNITKIDSSFFHTVNHLQHLDIGGNNISLSTNLLSGVASKLLSLGLSNMSLTELPRALFSSLSRVQNISLAHNKIRVLPSGSFGSLRQKNMRIELQHNEIRSVNVHFLKDARRPITVNLSSNSISRIEFLTANPCLASAATLDLSNNPLVCGPICGALLVMEKKAFDVEGTCTGPVGVIGYKLMWKPGISDPSLGYIERNATKQCPPGKNRQNEKFLCCEDRWVSYNSSLTCGAHAHHVVSLQQLCVLSLISLIFVLLF